MQCNIETAYEQSFLRATFHYINFNDLQAFRARAYCVSTLQTKVEANF
jgi:hypothetical protein